LSKTYKATKKRIELEINETVQELVLYHGTPYAEKIAKEGFDVTLSKTSENMFGKGNY